MPKIIDITELFTKEEKNDLNIYTNKSGKSYIVTNYKLSYDYNKLNNELDKKKFILRNYFPNEFNSDYSGALDNLYNKNKK
jgi:hypothetical protein